MTEKDLNTIVGDSSYQDVKRRFKTYRSQGIFTPPTEKGTIILPGYDGGGEWGGPAVDPETNILYVNANEMAWVLNLGQRKIWIIKNQCPISRQVWCCTTKIVWDVMDRNV
jgi:glucose dehydrogenase